MSFRRVVTKWTATTAAAFFGWNKTNNEETVVNTDKKVRIAIIGAGISGSSCSYFLNELARSRQIPNLDLKIDVFERDQVGGRMRSAVIGGQTVETGASIIHPKNQYMVSFAEMLVNSGLKTVTAKEITGDKLGLYDGHDFVYEDVSRWSIVNDLALLWHYGYDCLRYKWFIKDMLTKFGRIYELQSEGQCFTDVQSLLNAMSADFPLLLNISIKERLHDLGFNSSFITELASAIMIVNYGQKVDQVPAFVGAVSLAGAGDELWSVSGGNQQVAEGLIARSSATLHRCSVTTISHNVSSDKYSIECTDANNNRVPSLRPYDYIVLAIPLADQECGNIKFVNFTVDPSHYGPYHRTISSFAVGVPRAETWGRNDDELPNAILCCNPSLSYNSIAEWKSSTKSATTTGPDSSKLINYGVWKVFSHNCLDADWKSKYFSKIDDWQVYDWFAYPHYSIHDLDDVSNGNKRGSFKLANGVYHVNAIEWAASAMEMGAIGAKNVALLILKDIENTRL